MHVQGKIVSNYLFPSCHIPEMVKSLVKQSTRAKSIIWVNFDHVVSNLLYDINDSVPFEVYVFTFHRSW